VGYEGFFSDTGNYPRPSKQPKDGAPGKKVMPCLPPIEREAMDTWLGVVKDFGGVILGWVLGLGTGLIVDKVKGKEKREVVQRGILTELREVAHRLLFVVFLTKRRHGKMDRNLLEWMQTQIEKYEGPRVAQTSLVDVCAPKAYEKP
jgi:hypothetical protein